MAMRYSRGEGVDQDAEASLRMLEASAKGGHGPAQMALAALYQRGVDGKTDPEKAAYWFRAAAESGVEGADIAYASMLATGTGLPRDDETALPIFQSAAERGDAIAQYSLGIFYEEGRAGLEPSKHTAVQWWTRAANQGQAQAQAKLGVAMIRGEGTRKNVIEAYGWLAGSDLEEAKPWVEALAQELPPVMLERGKALAAERRALRESASAQSERAAATLAGP